MKAPKDTIVFPLDVPDRKEALRLARDLRDRVGLFKIGLELFVAEGPAVVTAVRDIAGDRIFLDLKLHDIPVTVQRAFLAACRTAPRFVTVHCDEGVGSLQAVAGNNPGNTRILAITVLTSLAPTDLPNLGYREAFSRDLGALARLKARLAKEAGCHGVVCSGHEAAGIRAELGPDFLLVTPGIRPQWSLVDKDDQKRVMTPERAIRNGADYLVIGRPIRDAGDPVEAAQRVEEEIASVLSAMSRPCPA